MSNNLYEMFNLYYGNAMRDKESGRYGSAKKNLYKAAKLLTEIASNSTGDMRSVNMERAKSLIDIADKLPEEHSSEKKGAGNSGKIKNNEDEDNYTFEQAKIPSISFEDVAGLEDVKKAVLERVILPIRFADYYKAANVQAGGGILMYGLPGTGKTMIAKAIAHEAGAVFYSIKCSDIVGKWFGEAEKKIKLLFETARKNDRAVIFFDEFESLAVKRGGNSTVMNRIVPELLSQLQGFEESENVLLVLAATNRPWDIDSAMMRPGRFNELIYVPLPDHAARKKIAELNLSKNTLVGFSVDEIADHTDSYNCSDVSELCSKMKVALVKKMIAMKDKGHQEITREMFEHTICSLKSTVSKQEQALFEKFRNNFNQSI